VITLDWVRSHRGQRMEREGERAQSATGQLVGRVSHCAAALPAVALCRVKPACAAKLVTSVNESDSTLTLTV
jgi:hypothetical protein